MNIFIIPSWYPSKSNPIYGTFNQEQARLMALLKPEWNIGVSTWGQGDDAFMLPAFSPSSYTKIFKTHREEAEELSSNLKQYFSPAFTWTRKLFKGNLNGILSANRSNLNRYMRDSGKPDIISAQASYPAAIIASHLSREFEIPYTVTIRMSPFPFKEFLKSESELKDIIRQPLKKANRLITTSESLKNRLSDFSLKHVTVVNNPIDLDFFKIKEKNSRKNRILTVGRMEEQKGIDILLKAIKKLEEPFELTIGGDGSKLLEYKQLCTDLDLDGKVTWLGQLSRDQVAIEMQKCSFYVLSSRHETFGNVILEAMSCGKPVVATRCGGPEEIVTNDTGLLCDISVDDLFAKINHMNKVYPSFDSSKIRKDAIDRYAPEVWIGNLEKVFRGML